MNQPYAIYADIGGTNARFASQMPNSQELINIKVYDSSAFPSPIELILQYLKDHELTTPDHATIAIAGPITGDQLKLTNLAWSFSVKEVAKQTGIKSLHFLNDFEALGASLPYLSAQEKIQIGEGSGIVNAPIALIGPGTGVGSAHLGFNGKFYKVNSAEGGQAIYAPQDLEDVEIIKFLMQKVDHPISIEDLLSGNRGISNLLMALAHIHNLELPKWDNKQVFENALEKKHPLGLLVLEGYCKILGFAAKNLALSTGATGGVFIGGGIVPRFTEYFMQSNFRHSFENDHLIGYYLKPIPTFLITAQYPAFIGLQHALEHLIS